jgi:WD40 repeat protein
MGLLKRVFGRKGKARLIAEIPNLSIEGCCFLSGKNTVAVSFAGGEIQLIDIEQKSVAKTLEGRVAKPGRIAVSRNGAHLAVLDVSQGGVGNGKNVEVWDLDSGSILLAQELERKSASIALSADGSKLAVGRKWEPIIDLYDVSTGQPTLELVGHDHTLIPAALGNDRVNDLEFSPDGQYLVSGADDGQAILWDLETRKGYSLLLHPYIVWRVCISHSGKTLASGGAEGWSTGEPPCLVGMSEVTTEKVESNVFRIRTKRPVDGLAFTLDDKRVLVASLDNTLWLWSGKPEAERIEHDFGKVLALSQDATKIAAERDEALIIWDVSRLVN